MKIHNKKKKMKEKQKQNPTLPFELIHEILLRLPVRSLLRFKCVCKSWLSLISNPQFAKSHFDLAASPTHRVIMNYTSDGHKIESLDFEASFHDDSALVNLNLPAPSPSLCGSKYPEALGSCRGFVLLANKQRDLIVWNPSTGVHKLIPYFYVKAPTVLYGFGYDSSADDYLIVFVRLFGFQTQLRYFSLKTNSWSDTQCIIGFEYQPIKNSYRAGFLLNGALHWLVFFSNHTKFCLIIAFDLMERSLSEIPLPHNLAMQLRNKVYYLRVMGGCLSLCHSVKGDRRVMAEIWIMQEYKVQSSWTKTIVLSIHDIPYNTFLPVCFTKCGGIFGSNGRETLVKLDDKGELLEHRSYMQEIGTYSNLHLRMYRESLLSLPSHSVEASRNDQQ